MASIEDREYIARMDWEQDQRDAEAEAEAISRQNWGGEDSSDEDED